MQILRPDAVWTPEGIQTGVGTLVDSGRIIRLVGAERHPGAEEVPLPGRLLLPGLVNAHSHAFQRAFRGHVQWREADRDDFWSWRDAMYRVANRLDPEGIEAVSALAFLEMAEAGVTQVGEFHYLHHAPDGTRYADPDELAKRVIAAALRVGIRICLLRVSYLSAGFGAPLRADQHRFGDRDVDEGLAALERLSAVQDRRVSLGIAPHSVRAVGPAGLRAAAAWGGVVHAHVSEQPVENVACQEHHGAGPLALFEAAGLLGPRFTAVHLTHPLPGDVERMAAADASVCV